MISEYSPQIPSGDNPDASSLDEIIDALKSRHYELPTALLREAARRREEITPHIKQCL
jgi:hypothetical protein